MNRTGLLIALALAAAVGLLFGVYPKLDLDLAGMFFDPSANQDPEREDKLRAAAARVEQRPATRGAWLGMRSLACARKSGIGKLTPVMLGMS